MPARLVYIAGQVGGNEDGALSWDVDKQVHQALCNLWIALSATNASVEKIVKLTLLIVDHSQQKIPIISRQLKEVWGEHPLPACTLMPVPRLALNGMVFEIDATAVITQKSIFRIRITRNKFAHLSVTHIVNVSHDLADIPTIDVNADRHAICIRV